MPAKKAQRTKGNVKPSSSAAAAQLLALSGQAATGFIGFSTQPAFVPVSEVLEEADTNLDTDFRLTLRKFSKRDTTTKIKALQEFISLCNTKDDASVKAVVPFWSRIYNKLAIDHDHKVRELSQQALSVLAGKVGKSLAPQLKVVMGTWLVSQCDTYPTVSSAAVAAFDKIFRESKQEEVLVMCKKEIIQILLTNILKQTPQTLSDPLTTSAEDMESKYQRVVASSLLATRKLLFGLSGKASAVSPQVTELLASPAFWKHAKSPVPAIKKGLLSLLSAVCHLLPDVSSQFLPKLCPFVISSLGDPLLMSQSWQAVLYLLHNHKECWEHVNWQKGVWPVVKSVLESGCGGQADHVAPCLLPLLKHLPTDLNITQFFNSFRIGLNEDSVLNSPSSCAALVHSFVRCIQQSISHIMSSSSQEKTADIRALIEDQLMIVVLASLNHPKASLSRTDLYSFLCPVLAMTSDLDPSIERSVWRDLSDFVVSNLILQYRPPETDTESKKSSPSQHISQRIIALVRGIVYQDSASTLNAGVRLKKGVRFEQNEGNSSRKTCKKDKKEMSESAEMFVSDAVVASFTLSSLRGQESGRFFSLFKELSLLDIPKVAASRLLKGTADRTAQTILSDLGLTDKFAFLPKSSFGSLEQSLASKLSLNDKENDTDQYFTFLCHHLIGKISDSGQDSEANVANSEVVETIFAFISYVGEKQGADFLAALLNEWACPVGVCQLISTLLDLSTSLPACRLLVQGPALSARIDALTAAVTADPALLSDVKVTKALWDMLTAAVALTEEASGPQGSESSFSTIGSSYLSTLRQFLTLTTSASVSDVMPFVRMARVAFQKQQLACHPLLNGVVLCLVKLRLYLSDWDTESVQEFELILEAGFRLMMMPSVVIDNRVAAVCHVMREYLLGTAIDLAGITRIKSLLQILAASTSGVQKSNLFESVDSEDGRSCLTEEASCPRLPEAIKSVIAENVLVQMEEMSVAEEEEILEVLYAEGRLSQPPDSTKPDSSFPSTPQRYVTLCLHNLWTVNFLGDVTPSLTSDVSTSRTVDSSQCEKQKLGCLADLVYGCVVAQHLHNRKAEAESEHLDLINELKSGVLSALSSLSEEEIELLFLLTSQRKTHKKHHFADLVRLLTNNNIPPAISQAIMSLQTQLLLRFSPVDQFERVESLLSGRVTGDDLCQAFSVTSTALANQQTVAMKDLAECLSGFLSLATDRRLLTDGVRVHLCDRLRSLADLLKARDVHLISAGDQDLSRDYLHFNTCFARFLHAVAVNHNEAFWEFALCILVEWIQHLSETAPDAWCSVARQALLVAVCRLACLAAQTFASAPVVAEMSDDAASGCVTEKAKTEWSEFFCEGVFTPLLHMFITMAGQSPPLPCPTLLSALSAAAVWCPSDQVKGHQLPAKLTMTDTSRLTDQVKTLLNHACPLLLSTHRPVQLAAYSLLSKIIEEISKQESDGGDDNKEEDVRSPPEALVSAMVATSPLLDGLMVAGVGEQVEVDAGHFLSHARGHLLSWALTLALFRLAPNLLRAKYAEFFKTQNSVNFLLDHLFRLMPPSPNTSLLDFKFEDLNIEGESSPNELACLSLWVYRMSLETLPALVRLWWVDQDRKSLNWVDKFTSQFLSTDLILHQISVSSKTSTDMEGITIRARPAAREVSAVYEMAEVSVTLTITLPANFPLGRLEVTCDKRVGVAQGTWDRWLLQLNIFLQHQNGNIEEGLRLWKGNIDKKFEGIEDCMICFSVIHGTNFQLPRLTCRTCHKKFHSACLYKWFSTSQKSSCPLCRELF